MKKLMIACLLLLALTSTVICAHAAESVVAFADGSGFAAGDTVTVDLKKTAENVMNSSGVTSDMYNAALEGNMDVTWRCSNGSDKYGSTITWTAEDVGKEYMCRVTFYSDKECTQFVDYVSGPVFTVAEAAAPTDPTPKPSDSASDPAPKPSDSASDPENSAVDTQKAEPAPSETKENSELGWNIVAVVLGVLVACMSVTIVVLLTKKF